MNLLKKTIKPVKRYIGNKAKTEFYSQLFIVATVEVETMSNSVRKFSELHKFINFSCERFRWLRQIPPPEGKTQFLKPPPEGKTQFLNICEIVLVTLSANSFKYNAYGQRWSPRGRPWPRGRPRGQILKSLALALASKVKSLASRPQVLENWPVLGSRTARFFGMLKFCGALEKFFGKRFLVEIA